MVDLCAKASATMKGFIVLQMYRRFIQCRSDAECFKWSWLQVIEMYTRKSEDKELDFSYSEEVKSAVMLDVRAISMTTVGRRSMRSDATL